MKEITNRSVGETEIDQIFVSYKKQKKYLDKPTTLFTSGGYNQC